MRTVTIPVSQIQIGDQLIRGISGLNTNATNKVENIIKITGLGNYKYADARLLLLDGKFYFAQSHETVVVQIDTNCR